MSDTPRTDELAKREFVPDGVWIRHARELERENAKLREAYEFLLEHGDIASVVICRADYILSNAPKIVMPRSTKP